MQNFTHSVFFHMLSLIFITYLSLFSLLFIRMRQIKINNSLNIQVLLLIGNVSHEFLNNSISVHTFWIPEIWETLSWRKNLSQTYLKLHLVISKTNIAVILRHVVSTQWFNNRKFLFRLEMEIYSLIYFNSCV